MRFSCFHLDNEGAGDENNRVFSIIQFENAAIERKRRVDANDDG